VHEADGANKEAIVRIIWTLIVVAVLVVVLGVWIIFSGSVDVAADVSQGGLLDWALSHTSDRSVEAHAARITMPDVSKASVPVGAAHYREMCVVCHGGPGEERSAISRGLNPSPPDLAESAKELKPREIYWIVDHGIRMTGMPSFGKTHDEEQLAAITAFVLRLPGMSTGEFQALADAGERAEGSEGEAGGQREAPPAPGEQQTPPGGAQPESLPGEPGQ
jgi:mono/diheme cytochrome c family protein